MHAEVIRGITVRPLRSGESSVIQAVFDRLGPTSRLLRFGGAKNVLTASDLEQLPQSIGVAAVEFLAEHAPGLELEPVRRIAASQSPALADVWDHWSDVRALLRGEVTVTPA